MGYEYLRVNKFLEARELFKINIALYPNKSNVYDSMGDAFKKENQDLTYIEYDHYHIHIQNFSSFYIAAAISGAYNILFRDKLEDRLYDFVQLQLNQNILNDKTLVSNKLKHLF